MGTAFVHGFSANGRSDAPGRRDPQDRDRFFSVCSKTLDFLGNRGLQGRQGQLNGVP